MRVALRALRWVTSELQNIIREREQRRDLNLVVGNV